MPELPEVTTITNDLDKELKGKVFLSLSASAPKMVSPDVAGVNEVLEGKRVKTVRRVGKMAVVDFGEHLLLIHLKLSGRLILKDKNNPPLRWERVRLDFEEGKSLRFEDLRMFGYVKLVDHEEYEKIVARLGKDALELSGEEFYCAIKRSSQAIKKVLLDQSKISGVGNIYANEALFAAKIHPEKKAKDLSQEEAGQLIKSVKAVLKIGIKARGATISDELYRDIYGERGHYEDFVLVYGRAGKPCPNKCGEVITKISLGGRGTYFCPRCQVG